MMLTLNIFRAMVVIESMYRFFVPHLKEGEDAKMSNRSILSLFVTLALALSLMCVLPAAAEGRYTPGTYVGEADGFGGKITVTVEVSENEIVSVEAVGEGETAGIGSNAIDLLPQAILGAQTLNVDTVAGCTISSKAVLAAAESALRQSGASDDVIFAEKQPTETAAVEDEVLETNVLIVGGGAAGLSAALSAHENGVKDVLVIEKMPSIGGATAMAGGGMPAYRVDEDPDVTEANIEELFLDLSRIGKFNNNARLTMMQARLSTPTIEWLKENGVGITGEPTEGEPLVNYGCEGRAAGAINTVYEKVLEVGVPVMLNTRAEHLIMDGNRVVGVEAQGSDGQKITILANKVLMATGGYGNNTSLISDTSILDRVIYYGPVGATGDGHIMMKEIGVPMFNMDKVATKHFGVETQPGYGIHIHWAVAQLFTKTSAIAVNKEGERVVDEGGDELDIALASMYKSSDGRLYIVMDQDDYDLFSSVLIKYNAFTQEQLDQMIAENGSGITKLVKADTLADAAKAMNIDGAKLEETVEAYNASIDAGERDAFKRAYTEKLSDNGPYYLFQTVARYATTLGGVNVSNNLEVLDRDEQPIPGLYAAGEVVGNINGSYAEYLIWCFGSGMEFGNVIAE